MREITEILTCKIVDIRKGFAKEFAKNKISKDDFDKVDKCTNELLKILRGNQNEGKKESSKVDVGNGKRKGKSYRTR